MIQMFSFGKSRSLNLSELQSKRFPSIDFQFQNRIDIIKFTQVILE